MAGGAVAAVVAGQAIPVLISAAGGFTYQPLGLGFAPLGVIMGHNLPVTAQSLLLLPGADFLGLPMGASTVFVMLHLVGVALAGCGIAVAAWRFPRETDRVNQVLIAAIAVTLVAFATGTHVFGLPSAREIAPVLPFAAVLAGRELARPLLSARRLADPGDQGGQRLAGRAGRPRRHPARKILLPLLAVVLAGYLAGLGLEISKPAAPPQAQVLTSWLEAHHLGTGLSGYWQANIVALTSGERVAVRCVLDTGGRISRCPTEAKAVWFDPARSSADFVVLSPGIAGYPGFTGRSQALATFGAPARTYHVGGYTIEYWHKNLLAELR